MPFSTVPFIFSPNTLIQSAQVNADFASLVSEGNNIDASQITTGTLPIARGGTGAATAATAATSLNVLPLTGGALTGPLNTNSNITSTATITGNQITSTGAINVAGNLGVNGDLTALGTIGAGAINSTGDVTSGGNLACTQTILANWGVRYRLVTAGSANVIGFGWTGNLPVWIDTAYQFTILTTSSDQRLKRDIAAPDADALDVLRRLPLVSYRLTDQPERPRCHIGLLAQRVQELIPEAIVIGPTEAPEGGTVEHPGLLHLDYNPILAYAIRAIQQLEARTQQLTARIAALETASHAAP